MMEPKVNQIIEAVQMASCGLHDSTEWHEDAAYGMEKSYWAQITDAAESASNALRDTRQALAASEAREKGLREALKAYQSAYPHEAPGDCFATGPMTGDEYMDLVACPGCAAAEAAALTSRVRQLEAMAVAPVVQEARTPAHDAVKLVDDLEESARKVQLAELNGTNQDSAAAASWVHQSRNAILTALSQPLPVAPEPAIGVWERPALLRDAKIWAKSDAGYLRLFVEVNGTTHERHLGFPYNDEADEFAYRINYFGAKEDLDSAQE